MQRDRFVSKAFPKRGTRALLTATLIHCLACSSFPVIFSLYLSFPFHTHLFYSEDGDSSSGRKVYTYTQCVYGRIPEQGMSHRFIVYESYIRREYFRFTPVAHVYLLQRGRRRAEYRFLAGIFPSEIYSQTFYDLVLKY